MVGETTSRLAAYLRTELGDDLRSVIHYDAGAYELVYVRDDVRERCSRNDLDEVVRELDIETREKKIKENLYAHGELDCTIRCFERGIEIQFVIGDQWAEGIAVGLEREALDRVDVLVGECLEIIRGRMNVGVYR